MLGGMMELQYEEYMVAFALICPFQISLRLWLLLLLSPIVTCHLGRYQLVGTRSSLRRLHPRALQTPTQSTSRSPIRILWKCRIYMECNWHHQSVKEEDKRFVRLLGAQSLHRSSSIQTYEIDNAPLAASPEKGKNLNAGMRVLHMEWELLDLCCFHHIHIQLYT
ncbi:hypothetical protein XELAEV_18016362mg [Xenopus laevis]|uniref:Uncharacterized protein n=1 Tax=Xenopus laevis TaxID=8355 RepID=A0A974DLR5_XENLA|nr:hypothetical protein XELAEV_18016362mg [Xenopus laevis]